MTIWNEFFMQITGELDALSVRYYVAGSVGSMMYAGPRATLDIDIVVDETALLRRLEEFCRAFPPPRYYADPKALRESLQGGTMNNILDTDSGLKADIISLKAHLAISRDAIRRRRRLIVDDGSGESRYVAAPEDIIIAKLVYYALWGSSEKHRRDTAGADSPCSRAGD